MEKKTNVPFSFTTELPKGSSIFGPSASPFTSKTVQGSGFSITSPSVSKLTPAQSNIKHDSRQFVRGSGISIVKPSASKHTVSHLMVLDKLFWDKELAKIIQPQPRSCVNGYTESQCNGGGHYCRQQCYKKEIKNNDVANSAFFTAEDDGEVFWKMTLSTISDSKYTVNLTLTLKPASARVHWYAEVCHDVSKPFCRKSEEKPYNVIKPDQDGPITTDFNSELWLMNGQKFRLDLTYLKYVKEKDQLTVLPGCAVPKIMENDKSFPNGSMETLLDNPVASDITLKVNGVEWRLHKCILATRSTVFYKMFTTDMIEKTTDSVTIEEVANTEAFDLMVKFIYTDKLDDITNEEAAECLMFLAERYDVSGLKDKVEGNLISRLNLGNCLSLYITAEKCRALQLGNAAKNMLVGNLRTVAKTAEWEQFAKENFEQSLEIVRSSL